MYSQQNLGGTGLQLPFNISAWVIVVYLIAVGCLVTLHRGRLIYPKWWFAFIVFPLVVIVNGVVTEGNAPIIWFFRQAYLLGGLAFVLALLQFQINQRVLDQCIFVLIIAFGLHSLLGMAQVYSPGLIPQYFHSLNDFVPRGIFQQINAQASFLATGLVVTLYFISRPSFRCANRVVQSVVVITFASALYIVVASGSRIGLLSLIIAIPLVVWSRFHQLKSHKTLLLILVLSSCGGFIAGQVGLHETIDKTTQLTEKSYSTARVTMYTIGMELVAKEPIYGYGIGGFLKAWNLQASDFVLRHPEASLPQYVTHPHNETLFWMIEAGLPALFGILVFVIATCLALYQCGFQRGGAYAAMLLPISLHTQVELPFYISSLHWFLWLFLIYLVLRRYTKTAVFNLSLSMRRLIQIASVSFPIGVTLFMVSTAHAQLDLYDFFYKKNKQAPYLELALDNVYTKNMAEQILMSAILYSSIENGDESTVETFEGWALNYVITRPELKMYQDLISASIFLRPEGKGCDAIIAGLKMYGHNKPFKLAYEKCKQK